MKRLWLWVIVHLTTCTQVFTKFFSLTLAVMTQSHSFQRVPGCSSHLLRAKKQLIFMEVLQFHFQCFKSPFNLSTAIWSRLCGLMSLKMLHFSVLTLQRSCDFCHTCVKGSRTCDRSTLRLRCAGGRNVTNDQKISGCRNCANKYTSVDGLRWAGPSWCVEDYYNP